MLGFDKKDCLLLSTCISMTGCKDYIHLVRVSMYPKKEILAPEFCLITGSSPMFNGMCINVLWYSIEKVN